MQSILSQFYPRLGRDKTSVAFIPNMSHFNPILLTTIIVVVLCISTTKGKDLGKLECTEKDGLKPDSTLLNLIVSKCQPKQGQPEKMIAACLMKCLMKQQKAVDKKGKLKADKAVGVVDIFPSKFKSNITERFNHCCTENNDKLKKEPNGCESWLPFTECFFQFGKNLCPTEKERKRLASTTPGSGTTTPESESTTPSTSNSTTPSSSTKCNKSSTSTSTTPSS